MGDERAAEGSHYDPGAAVGQMGRSSLQGALARRPIEANRIARRNARYDDRLIEDLPMERARSSEWILGQDVL
jgi:hypothetical protein